MRNPPPENMNGKSRPIPKSRKDSDFNYTEKRAVVGPPFLFSGLLSNIKNLLLPLKAVHFLELLFGRFGFVPFAFRPVPISTFLANDD